MKRTLRAKAYKGTQDIGLIILTICLGIVSVVGCGDDDNPKTITITVTPTAIDFGRPDLLYFVEKHTTSVWGIRVSEQSLEWTGQLAPGGQGGFTPWGLSTDAAAEKDVLFVTDASEQGQRLLAVRSQFGFNLITEAGIVIASTAGPGQTDRFTGLRAAAAYTISSDIVRVFVADTDRVVSFDFVDSTDPPSFVFKHIIRSPATDHCPHPFGEVYGLAVDPENNFLYVVDRASGILFRFTGVHGESPSCQEEIRSASGRDLYRPQGAVVLGGRQHNHNIVIITDSGNDRIALVEWNGESLEEPSLPFRSSYDSLDNPFDVALDKDTNLWITYPDLDQLESWDDPETWPAAGS